MALFQAGHMIGHLAPYLGRKGLAINYSRGHAGSVSLDYRTKFT